MNDQRLFHPHGPVQMPTVRNSTRADQTAGEVLQQRVAAPHHKRLFQKAAPTSLQAAPQGTKAPSASA